MLGRGLDSLQNRLGFNVRYILTGGSWLVLYQAASLFSLVALSIAFARLLPRSTYGEYGFILSAAAVIGAFSLKGLNTAIAQSTARGFDGSLYAGVREQLRWSVVMVGAAASLAIYFLAQGNPPYAISFAIVATTLPLFQAASLADFYLLGKRIFKTRSLQKTALSTLSAGCVIIALFLKAGLVALVAAYFVSRTVIEIVSYLWTTVRYPPANLTVEDGFVRHAASLSGLDLLATFADEADSLFLFALTGPVAVAVYSFAVAAPELMKGAIKNYISWLGVPVFAKHSPAEARRSLVPRMLVAAAATLVAIGAYILAAPLLFRILLPQYLDAVEYSQIFSLSLVLVTMANFPITALRSMAGTKREYYRFLIVVETLQVVLLFAGIRAFGIAGAIGAYMLVRLIRLGYSSFLLYRA